MPTQPSPLTTSGQDDAAAEGELRAGIVRLGARLGWDARTVARFAAAVTGRSWRQCGPTELERVLEAYATLAGRVRTAQAGQPDADGRMP